MIGVGDRGPVAPAGEARREREALAVLVSVFGLGPVTLQRLVSACGSARAVLDLAAGSDAARRLAVAGSATDDTTGGGSRRELSIAIATAIVDAAERRDQIVERIAELDLRLVAEGDLDYPQRLRTIELPPALLFVRGDPAVLNAAAAVAVVGTRRPSDAGRRTAARIGAALARAQALVVSGLAIGIDGAAHAAVVGEGGRTVAFIGGGHARLFPLVHDRLAAAIVDAGGAICSEYPPDVEPTKGTFPRRNRLISGAADAVVVVEAGARSGALLTASWALEQGRECFLVPGSIDEPMSAGCLGFLRDWPGAARIVSGIPQLLDDLGLPGAAALPELSRPAAIRSLPATPTATVKSASARATVVTIDPRDEEIAVALAGGAVTVDELVAVTSLTVAAVLAGLTRLEAAGLARNRYGRYTPEGSLALRRPPARRRAPVRPAAPPAA
jgi:DNA processing protein